MHKAKPLYCEHFLEDIGSKMLTFDGLDNVRKLMGPGVYMVANHFGEPLYVGMAGNVLARISDESHTSLRRALKEGYRLYVIFATSDSHARGLETELIRMNQPKYNVRGKASPESVEYYRQQAAQEDRERRDPELMRFKGEFREALNQRLG